MYLNNFSSFLVAALAGTAFAMPHFSGAYHGERIAISVPGNATKPHNASTPATTGRVPLTSGMSRPKNGTSRHIASVHGLKGASQVNSNDRCNDLCSLEAHTCNLAVPDDDKFW
ncbi:hypothetical protein N7468_002461 [Penicillium chermesinum]|uniref:Uncharacterized protein n=1 Tax=Penicillium chermesinum TaxID=63820 RepID=A0A9W9TYG5_9EURO|nr:uncharacterized protein N7468_002461 [Penicillium chermesinum]KAJ5247478.1 hypothetical protein N7468_002461 [Penicillium chermesinum]KAJ6145717.1 hypothetical protein N7470_009612 [Penicillium chermesinum]